ncbi:MAG: endonuclease/exonuclease/phosphatase family protein [Flavobacteriales bacterium]
MKYIIILTFLLTSCLSREIRIPIPKSNDWFKIMSFNVKFDTKKGKHQWNKRRESCIKMINDKQPDVFGTQEGLLHQMKYLDNKLSDYSYYGVGRNDGVESGEHIAIFYKKDIYNLLDKGVFWLSETPNYSSKGWDAALNRIVTWVKLKDINTNQIFFVFNTHFDHKGKNARIESSKLIIKKINEITHIKDSVYIIGDFNGRINNRMFTPIINNSFKNAKEIAKSTDQKKSYNSYGRLARIFSTNIDFIFYNQNTAIYYETIDKNYGVKYISDHYPIMCYFQIN